MRWEDNSGLSRWVLDAITSVLVRERQREITQTKEGHYNMATEAEIGVMMPQSKECRQPPGDGRIKEWILP